MGLSLSFILTGLVFVTGGKTAANPQVLGAFDPPFIWPSARTAIPVWMTADRYGTVPPMDKTYILNFWAGHYDLLLDGQPYDEVKAINPNIRNLSPGSLSYFTMYTRPEYSTGEHYWGGIGELKTWVEAHWQEYAWASQFTDAAEAFEDCFIHVNQEVTASFVKTTEEYIIPAYDPANPKLSRLPGPWDIDYDWMMNVGSPVYISFWQDYYMQQLGAQATEGVFLDSTGSGWIHLWVGPTKTVEYNTNDDDTASRLTFTNDIRSLTASVQAGLQSSYPDKKLAINDYNTFEANVTPKMLDFQNQADILWRENGIHNNRTSTDMKNEIEADIRATEAGKIVVLDQSVELCSSVIYCGNSDVSYEPWNDPACMACVDQERRAGLAAYYQVMNDNIYFSSVVDLFFAKFPFHEEDPAIYAWYDAMGYDIGQPVSGFNSDWAHGQDPSQPGLTYYVFAREYTDALVLFKAKPAGSPTHGVYGANSETIHQLDAAYRPLKPDGTLGDPVTSVTLRNWDGAILIKPDTTPPAAVNDLSGD